jgi:hypothetical protein
MSELVWRLWNELSGLPFPDRIPREVRERLDLELLDSDSASCIESYLALGTLTPEQAGILRACRDEVRALPPTIGREAVDYFTRLERLATLVLERVDRRRPHGLA